MNHKLLLVECLVSEQERLTKSLSDRGYEVVPACDADWALAYWWMHGCDVVIVGDAFGKRITDGEQLAESIKELDPDQPVVMLRKSDTQLLLEVSAF